MKTLVVGLGIQGEKRLKIAKKDVVATVDPYKPHSTYKNIYDVPLEIFDSAILCIQDDLKIEFIKYLLKNNKNVMVEKPLFSPTSKSLDQIKRIAHKNKVTFYTAYNHRFEPHFINMRNLIKSNELGNIYAVRIFYGNGTAKLVRDSKWRDKGAGVLPDLGSHILDTLVFWFEKKFSFFEVFTATKNENKSYDNVIFGIRKKPSMILETSLLSWRNHFYADIYGQNGSAHISSLCKWGPSKFTVRKRIIPSGRPTEKSIEIVSQDPTWQSEYKYFKDMVSKNETNIDNDIWINKVLNKMIKKL